MTIKFPTQVRFSRAAEVAAEIPGDRERAVQESEDQRRYRQAQEYRELRNSQQLAGSHTVGHRRTSWEPMPPAIPADQWLADRAERRREAEQIEWQAHEHGEPPPAPEEITVERIPDLWERKALALSAEIDEMRRRNSPWKR